MMESEASPGARGEPAARWDGEPAGAETSGSPQSARAGSGRAGSPQLGSTPELGGSGSGGADAGGPGPGEPDDPLYPAVYQLARFYAILSPGIVQRDLDVDRPRAERLIALLVERNALGPVIVEHSGARESRVNMIFDGERQVDLSPAPPTTTRRAGGIAVLATALGAGLGFAACVGILAFGLGSRVVASLGLGLFSPALAEVLGLLIVPAALGGLVGLVFERLLSPGEEQVAYRLQQVRRSLWTLYALAALGYGALQLFR